VKADNTNHKLRQLTPCLVIIGSLCALAGLWWTSSRAAVNFLPDMTPARWIIYPVIPDANTHPVLELATTFENSFGLDVVPPKALLRIAGFHRYTLTVNGSCPEWALRTGANWKQPDKFDVSRLLRPGTNRIEVTVFNSDGPPALWLSLDVGTMQVNSGIAWEASYAGAAWHPAVPASAPKSMTTSSYSYGLPPPLAALGTCWPTLLGFVLLSCAGLCPWRKMPVQPAPPTPQRAARDRLREMLPVMVLAGSWMVLFANNCGGLSRLTGFDAPAHADYIRYIQEHGSLPLASEGWEMFQPPLYYLLSAIFLKLLHLSVSDAGGITALRLLGLTVGVTHLVIIWATLRQIFPAERSKAGWGILLAACLPPMIYLSHHVSNEAFAAMMTSACVWLTLRALRQEPLQWKSCAWLGLCLGAALLAKATALLVLPPVFGALLWKWLERRALQPKRWVAQMSLIVALCALTSGWHYARLWIDYGSPLISNMSPKLGFPWWQDDGYRTSAFYLRFGDVLSNQWSSTFQGYWDGLYATLWGDGLLSGALNFPARLPWNYDLMAVGYWLAILPTLAVIVVGCFALSQFVRLPSPEWFLLLGFSCMVLWALACMSLVVPAQSSKAFYGLSALVALCAFGALGLDFLTRRTTILRYLVCVAFGVWAINSYACFWISRSSVPAAIEHACALVRNQQYADATNILKQKLFSEPRNRDLQFSLAFFLTTTGRVDEGARLAEMMVREHPDDCRSHHVLALAAVLQQQPGKAIDEIRQVMALAPGYDPSWKSLAPFLIEQGNPDATIDLIRQALAAAPFCPELRFALGSALMQKNQDVEAAAQLRYACLLMPQPANTLATLAWKLATAPNPAERNGAVAVRLAEEACALHVDHQTIHMLILAAAYAEAARYPEAVKTAEQAHLSAVTSRDFTGAALTQQLIELFKTAQPYRDIRPQ
jgi:Tfp pilus assembly protein PilF